MGNKVGEGRGDPVTQTQGYQSSQHPSWWGAHHLLGQSTMSGRFY